MSRAMLVVGVELNSRRGGRIIARACARIALVVV